MKTLVCACVCLLGAALARAQVPPSYTLSFDDEFNGTSVDTSVWQYRTDGKLLSQQLAANVSESGGYLHVAVKQQTSGSYSYTGGGVITHAGYGYGYYEASVKVPPGTGWHSSFWAMGYNGTDTGTQDADQELDFMEQDSGNLSAYTANYHFWPTGYATGATISGVPNMNTNFNTIGCLYTPYGTTYYLNGVQVEAINTSSYASNSAQIWLTSIATTTPDTSKLPAEFLVDWVHYYAPPAAGSAPAAPANLTATPGSSSDSLSWSAPLGASTYHVKRAAASGGPYTTLATGVSATSYTDSSVSSGTTYYYVVSAVSPVGVESANSPEARAAPGSIIVDDAAATGVAITGAWTSSTYTAGYYGSDYLQDGDAGGGKSVAFTPSFGASGYYAVSARWTSGANRATNAPIDVYDGTGTTTTQTVNQQLNNGAWVDLGAYYFASGASGYVKVRDDGANGFVIADAVQFVPATVVILDDTAASGVTISGSWTSSTYTAGYYGSDYLQDGDAGGGKSVTYAPTLPATGTYKVYGRWTSGANRATNARFDIHDGTGATTTVYENQQANNGAWVLLGTFSFNAGSSGYVAISDTGANGYVIADAVQWVLQ